MKRLRFIVTGICWSGVVVFGLICPLAAFEAKWGATLLAGGLAWLFWKGIGAVEEMTYDSEEREPAAVAVPVRVPKHVIETRIEQAPADELWPADGF